MFLKICFYFSLLLYQKKKKKETIDIRHYHFIDLNDI